MRPSGSTRVHRLGNEPRFCEYTPPLLLSIFLALPALTSERSRPGLPSTRKPLGLLLAGVRPLTYPIPLELRPRGFP
jgi:hypothetical protein